MTNPLLEYHALPSFTEIRPEHAEPAVRLLIERNKTEISRLLETRSPASWEGVLKPIEELDDQLARCWSPVSHLNAVLHSEAMRDAYNACLPLLSDYSTWTGQNRALFEAYQQIADRDDFAQLHPSQQRAVHNALRDFTLSGVALPAAEQARFAELKQRLSSLGASFSDRVLDATDAWHKTVQREDLDGVPEIAVAAARRAADEAEEEDYRLSLDMPMYLAIMTHSNNAELRREMYTAYSTRASALGPHAGEWDNSDTITEILDCRKAQAELLGFANFAELSLATKMARDTSEVLAFLEDLARRARPQAQREWQELCDFARAEHAVEQLQAWDVAYYSEKLRQSRYAISQEEIRPYLPLPRALEGLFQLVKQLYNIDMEEVGDFATYHDDVQLFAIKRDGAVVAHFYLDLYARSGKRGGAWMADCSARRERDTGLQLPVAFLVCNFSAPAQDSLSLLTHTELTTLFHEFGHGLHHMLTAQTVASVSGINGVEWDAVELPSQFLENWCWEADALAFITGHVASGDPLPATLLDKLLAARNFQSAMQIMRQLEFALFDFRLHQEWDTPGFTSVQQLLDEVREAVAVFLPPSFNRFQNSFSHIFAGGYAAGYYSYKWAEVLSADAFSRFEEEGVLNGETGREFLREVLEVGGSRDAMETFKAFRGREPDIRPLLRHAGIAA